MPSASWTQPYSRTSPRELKAMRRIASGILPRPRVSLLMMLTEPHEAWIRATFDSLRRQVYPAWELCVCDNGSTLPHVATTLRALRGGRRLRVRTLSVAAPASEGLGLALSLSSGEFCAVIDCGDTLAPDALFRVVELMTSSAADVVYTDENAIDDVGELSDPILKPHWSPDLLLATNYVGRLCVVRRNLIDRVNGFGADCDANGEYEHDLLLRVSERTKRVSHLPGVMYHRRTLHGRRVAATASRQAAAAAVSRRRETASIRREDRDSLRIARRETDVSTVAALIRLGPDAVASPLLDALAADDRIEEVVVFGGGRVGQSDRVERVVDLSPARAGNLAVETTTSECLLFVDGSGRVRNEDGEGWIRKLLAHAARRGIGAVGCKLLYRDGRLRQGGRLIDLDALSQRPSERMPTAAAGAPAADMPFNPAVVRADCMVVTRKQFEAVGGFDAGRLPASLYDVDLALRLGERGLHNVYTPDSTFVCGFARESPPADEIAYLWERWWEVLRLALSYEHEPARLAWRDSAELAIPLSGGR
jgi:O-antigen biosynthesis protein